MSKGLEVLDMLTENSPAQSDDESVTIQAVKVKKEKIDRRRKGNHERTEAQKKAFEAVKAKRDAIRKERIEKRTAEEQQLKEELKKKVKNALSKRQSQLRKNIYCKRRYWTN